MSDSIYLHSDQRERHPSVAVAFDALGALLASESRRNGDAAEYATVIGKLLAIVGMPTVEAYEDKSYGRTDIRYKVTHPDSRVQACFQYKDQRQLREMGLIPNVGAS